MHKSAATRGMTLLEIMIALLLLGVLSTFVVNVVDSVVGLWQQGERRGRGDLVYASVAERLQSDLRALHLGDRGWMIIDDYVARPAADGVAEWRLPRLRFLATGGGLSADDPLGTHAVEIMWMLVPERALGPRFAKLVRVAQIEGLAASLQENGAALSVAGNNNAITIVDGILNLSFITSGTRNNLVSAAYSGLNFPTMIELEVERVAGNARKKPPRLDAGVDGENASVVLRGIAPLKMPPLALINDEWVAVGGNFPRISFSARAKRDTIAVSHDSGSYMYFPTLYASRHPLLNSGRRAVDA
ncbi:MAG: prepilin-type N-terminal cleavage/methylation domain-containing protein [Myxococcota bacterium]|jgi:prepilin-type N-terminal cleavage/methylation domain-containing protein